MFFWFCLRGFVHLDPFVVSSLAVSRTCDPGIRNSKTQQPIRPCRRLYHLPTWFYILVLCVFCVVLCILLFRPFLCCSPNKQAFSIQSAMRMEGEVENFVRECWGQIARPFGLQACRPVADTPPHLSFFLIFPHFGLESLTVDWVRDFLARHVGCVPPSTGSCIWSMCGDPPCSGQAGVPSAPQPSRCPLARCTLVAGTRIGPGAQPESVMRPALRVPVSTGSARCRCCGCRCCLCTLMHIFIRANSTRRPPFP